jgi:hypothetical protein
VISKPSSALRVVLALSAIVVLVACVGSASAAGPQWYTGTETSQALLTGTEAASIAPAVENVHPFAHGKTTSRKGVHFYIPHFLGSSYELIVEASGVECSGCTIKNSEGTGSMSGTITFTGATATLGGGSCQIESWSGKAGTFSTTSLKTQWTTASGKQYVVFAPAAGSVVIQFALGGLGCESAAGKYNISGVFLGESVNPLWSQTAKVHNLDLSGDLKAGTSTAGIEGTIAASLPSGKYWSAK